MMRSTLAVLAFVILSGVAQPPAPVHAQEARTHEVRQGDTLWKIAEQVYQNGRLWTRIYEANRDRMDSPDDLTVGLVLTIPPAQGPITAEPPAEAAAEVVVVPPAGEPQAAPPQQAPPARQESEVRYGPKPITERTAFFPDTTSRLRVSMAPMLSAVSPDVVYSAPWLIPLDREEPAHTGQLFGFAGAEGDMTRRSTARPHDRMLVTFEGPAPAIGTLLHVFRIDHEILDVGEVVRPTGVVRVNSLEPNGAVAVVEKLYARMAVGDFVAPLPAYPLSEGQHAEDVTTGPEADIIAFANPRPVYSIGDIAFLDQGSANGVRIGDEYIVVFSSAPGWTGEVEGRLQVVAVHPDHAAARIKAVESPIFVQGVRVRLDRKMR